MAFHYPLHPTTIQKKIYHRFIHNLYEFIPTKTIGTTFQKLLIKNPVSPYLDNRKDFIKWMHHMHNLVNIRIGVPTITLEQHVEDFNSLFESKQDRLERLWKEKLKLIGMTSCVILIPFFIYKRSQHK